MNEISLGRILYKYLIYERMNTPIEQVKSDREWKKKSPGNKRREEGKKAVVPRLLLVHFKK